MARRIEEIIDDVFPLVISDSLEPSSVEYEPALISGPVGLLINSSIVLSCLFVAQRYLKVPWHEHYLTVALVNIFSIEIITSIRNLYSPWRPAKSWQEIGESLFSWTVAFAAAVMVLSPTIGWPDSDTERLLTLHWYGLSLVAVAASYAAMCALHVRHGAVVGRARRKAAFIGATETSERLASLFRSHRRLGFDVIGCYDDRVADWSRPLAMPRAQIAGTVDDLLQAARAGDISDIYISLPLESAKRIKAIIERFAQDTSVSIYYCPPFGNFDLINARLRDVSGQPVISIVESPFVGYRRYVKRLEDLVLSLLILPFLLPPMMVIAAAVKLTSPGPIFFRQTRNGLDGRPFKIWKFRTMHTVETDAEFVQATKGDARITRLGHLLRDTSLDELPQFFNVVRGEMSLVGPRPAPVKYNDVHRQLVHRYMVRHKVKPGITGLAQVKGSRGETETLDKTEQRTEYDLQYIRNWSVRLDIRILFQTLFVVFRQIPARYSRD
jgi:putative colanic acid biosysnthesis UDP-glucose lipid carrier transferase